MLAYFKGKFIDDTEVRLSLNDAGFIFGATVTDQCRTFHHQLFRLEDHVARFHQSCQLARIRQPVSDQEIIHVAKELTSNNSALLPDDKDLRLVMFATPGTMDDDGPPTLGMHTYPLPLSRYAPLLRKGAHLVVPATRQLPASSIDPRIKHRSRLHWLIAEREAELVERGAWALLLDTNGYMTETAASNFLIVKEGVVCTPPRSAILGGISLLTVEEICKEKGILFQERPITLNDCLQADEALLTGTSFCIAGVSRIGAASIPWPGKIFEQLLQAWNQRVGLDIRAQILSEG